MISQTKDKTRHFPSLKWGEGMGLIFYINCSLEDCRFASTEPCDFFVEQYLQGVFISGRCCRLWILIWLWVRELVTSIFQSKNCSVFLFFCHTASSSDQPWVVPSCGFRAVFCHARDATAGRSATGLEWTSHSRRLVTMAAVNQYVSKRPQCPRTNRTAQRPRTSEAYSVLAGEEKVRWKDVFIRRGKSSTESPGVRSPGERFLKCPSKADFVSDRNPRFAFLA